MPSYSYLLDTGLGTDEVAICNRALLRVGSSKVITSLSDDTEAARICNAVFAMNRDEVLTEADWPFARRYAVLVEVADVNHPAWTYGYTLPADYLVARAIWSGIRRPVAATPYTIELSEDGTTLLLLTDEAPVTDAAPYLRYTARVTDVALFDLLFSDALAWRIAIDLFALTKKSDLRDQAVRGYELTLSKAEVSVAEGEALDVAPDSEFVTIRS